MKLIVTSLYELNLTPTFGSASYHPVTSLQPHHFPVATGLRLRLTVTFYVRSGESLVVLRRVCYSSSQELREEEGNARTRNRSRWEATACQQKNVE